MVDTYEVMAKKFLLERQKHHSLRETQYVITIGKLISNTTVF